MEAKWGYFGRGSEPTGGTVGAKSLAGMGMIQIYDAHI